MAKFRWSEIFISTECEAAYCGYPTIYLRLSKCNFKCKSFNNPTNLDDGNGYAPLGFDPKLYTTLESLPIITKGCDSQYSVNDNFSHLWISGTEDDIVQELHKILPYNSFLHPYTGYRVPLSLTGGEPSLFFKQIPSLLNHPLMKECKHIIFETNCSVPISWKTVGDINQWLCADSERRWTWSNSPKLSGSGEQWDKAIIPKVACMQRCATGKIEDNQMDQYFKFVVRPLDSDFDEVDRAMEEYYAAGISRNVPVWMMPTACVVEQQDEIAAQVAKMCIQRGRIFCYRTQMMYGNGVGT